MIFEIAVGIILGLALLAVDRLINNGFGLQKD